MNKSSDSEKYIEIINWERFQHLDHQAAARWCKLHVSMLDDEDFLGWSWSLRGLWCSMLILRARLGRNLPADPVMLRRMLGGDPVQASVVYRSLSVLVASGHIRFVCNKYPEKIRAQSRVEKSRVEYIPPYPPKGGKNKSENSSLLASIFH